MKIKSLNLAFVLAVGMLSTGIFANEPVHITPLELPSTTSSDASTSNHHLNLDAPITRAEFITTIIITTEGSLPIIMDTHYALPAMERAEALGLIDLNAYPMNTWSEIMPVQEKIEVLTKATKNADIDMEKVSIALSNILINTITVDGETVDLGKCTLSHSNGKVMIPLKTIAKEMGFDVTWDSKTYTATLNNGKIKSNVQVGFDSYNYTSVNAIGMSAPFSAGASPKLIEGSVYVPAEYFSMFADIAVNNNAINFTLH